MAISETIPSLGSVPQTSDPANFDARADTLLGTSLPAFRDSVNTWAGQANSTATTINANAATAAAAAVTASAAATNAADSAIIASNTSAWVSGEALSAGANRWSLLTFKTYRLMNDRTALENVVDPANDSTNWLQLNGSVPTILGPLPGAADLIRTTSIEFTISNYDIATTYVLSTDFGTISRSADVITWTVDTLSAAGASFVINGHEIGGYTVVDLPPSQIAYTTAGTYDWVCPDGVSEISVVCVGAGACNTSHNNRNGGGALGYKNNVAVVAGQTYEVVVPPAVTSGNGANATFNTNSVGAEGGKTATGTVTLAACQATPLFGSSGGNSQTALTGNWFSGGSGAGGYSGDGGYVDTPSSVQPTGGGAGGGGRYSSTNGVSGAGGGVGILGEGANGVTGTSNSVAFEGGTGGSGGTNGTAGSNQSGGSFGTSFGGLYGGGGAARWHDISAGSFTSGRGAVRIIWKGTAVDALTRAFPSTNTGDL